MGLGSAAGATGGCGRSTCVSALKVEKVVLCSLTDIVAAAGGSAAWLLDLGLGLASGLSAAGLDSGLSVGVDARRFLALRALFFSLYRARAAALGVASERMRAR